MLGDFNFHVNDSADVHAKKFLTTLTSFNLIQHVRIPIHEKLNTLDLVISRGDLSVANILTDDSVQSDHSAVLFTISSLRPGLPKATIQFRKWRNVVLDKFQHDLQESLRDMPQDLEEAAQAYNSRVTSVVDKHAPLHTKEVVIRPDAPWYCSELEHEKRIRRRLEREKKVTRLEVDRAAYAEQRNKYNHLSDKACSNHYRENIINATSSKWAFYNKMFG